MHLTSLLKKIGNIKLKKHNFIKCKVSEKERCNKWSIKRFINTNYMSGKKKIKEEKNTQEDHVNMQNQKENAFVFLNVFIRGNRKKRWYRLITRKRKTETSVARRRWAEPIQDGQTGSSRMWMRLSDPSKHPRPRTSKSLMLQPQSRISVLSTCRSIIGWIMFSFLFLLPPLLKPRRNRDWDYLLLHRRPLVRSVGRERKCKNLEREKAHRLSLVLSRVKVFLYICLYFPSSIFFLFSTENQKKKCKEKERNKEKVGSFEVEDCDSS